MLINATYMGRHEYGKRSKVQRPTIVREVPAIVDETTWKKAQQVLKSNFLFRIRSNKHLYLLRGIAKCGLTFIGTHANRPGGKVDSYYRCNGKHAARGIYGKDGQRCPSKDVNGFFLENAIWTDIEQFLRNPGEVGEILRQKIAARTHDRAPEFDRRSLEIALETKAEERARVLGLFRKGRIDEAALNAQLDEIVAEEESLRTRLTAARNPEPEQGTEALASVPVMLEKLREKLDAGLTWDLKRQLVEVLVDGIRIDTIDAGNRREAVVNVRYRFVSSLHTCTDTRAAFNCTLERVHWANLKRAA